jgi:hypothetical protein
MASGTRIMHDCCCHCDVETPSLMSVCIEQCSWRRSQPKIPRVLAEISPQSRVYIFNERHFWFLHEHKRQLPHVVCGCFGILWGVIDVLRCWYPRNQFIDRGFLTPLSGFTTFSTNKPKHVTLRVDIFFLLLELPHLLFG